MVNFLDTVQCNWAIKLNQDLERRSSDLGIIGRGKEPHREDRKEMSQRDMPSKSHRTVEVRMHTEGEHTMQSQRDRSGCRIITMIIMITPMCRIADQYLLYTSSPSTLPTIP